MLNHFNRLLGFALILGLISCGKKAPPPQANLSGNRVQGIVLRLSEQIPSSDRRILYESLINSSLAGAYGAKLVTLSFAPQSLLEDPENIYQVGKNLIDDLFLFSVQETQDTSETSVTIYNGSNLKIVTILKFSVPREGKDPFEKRWNDTFRRVALEKYPNPNIYPRATPSHFANLLYVYSQQEEKNLKDPITCLNALQIFQFYPKAKELFELAKEKEPVKIVGSQQVTQSLDARLTECDEKSKALQRCLDDNQKTFAIQWEFSKIDPVSHSAILQAAATSDLEGMFKQYTNKPVTLRVEADENAELNFIATMRFDPVRYTAWTKNRVPARARNYQILSLDPYFALMQKFVVFRSSLPTDAPAALKLPFSKMKLNFILDTIFNGQVLMGVEGKYDPKTKSITMAYPNSVYLRSPGFEQKLIEGRDKEIYQEKTWIALGNCKTIDGTTTEDGLLIQFFGLPCN